MPKQGWLKLHRKLTEWEWADSPKMMSLFIHLLLEANHKERSYRGFTLAPGQVIFSRKLWSEKTGISEQSLRTCLSRLESGRELTIKSTSRFTVLTIENWGKYQPHLSQPASTSTSDQPAINQPLYIRKKECKNKRNPPLTPSKNPQNVDNSVDNSIKPLKRFNILKYLTEDEISQVRRAHPRWDIEEFAKIYDQWIQTYDKPNHPLNAFMGWMDNYTKNMLQG